MFAVPQNALTNWEGYYAVIEREYSLDAETGIIKDTQTVTVPFAEWDTSGSYYVVTYKGLAAKEMADKLTVTIYNAKGEAISNPWEDSMRDYAMRRLEKVTTDVERALFVNMLEYGATAQEYFGYGTEDLANNRLSEEQKGWGGEAKAFASGLDQGDKFAASNLILKSNISLYVAFNGLTPEMSAKVEFTKHDKTEPTVINIAGTEFGKSGNMYYVPINALVVADARQVITITIYNADGSEYTTCQESIEDYLARRSSVSELFAATMKFADSAYAYLHRNDK